MATNLRSFFGGIKRSAEDIRRAAQDILGGKISTPGTVSAQKWARAALRELDTYEAAKAGKERGAVNKYASAEDYAEAKLSKAYSWITGGAQKHKAARMFQKAESGGEKLLAKIQNEQANIANILDIPATATAAERATLEAKAARRKQALQSRLDVAGKLGLDTTSKITKVGGSYIPTADLTYRQRMTRAAERQVEIERAAGIATNVAGGSQATTAGTMTAASAATLETPTTAVTETETATTPTYAAVDKGLAETVMATDENLSANKDFVNAVFKAYHGRDATAQELSQYTGQNVGSVRQAIAGGSPLNRSALGAAPSFSAALSSEFGVDAFGSAIAGMDDALFSGVSSGNSFVDSSVKGWEALFRYFSSAELKMAKASKTAALARIEALTGQLGQEPARLAELQREYDVSGQYKKLQETNLLIAQKMASYEAGALAIQGQTIPMGLLVGQQAALQRQQAVDLGALTAVAAVYTNNINLANDLIKQTLDIEFGSIMDELNATKTLFQAYSDVASAEESKTMQKIQFVLGERERVLGEQKKEKERVYGLMLAVAESGGDVSVIDTSKSYEENLRATSKYFAPTITTTSRGGGGTVSTGVIGEEGTGGGVLVDSSGKPIKLTAGQVDTLSGLDTTIGLATDALALLRKGVKTGPIQGRLLSIGKFFGTANPDKLKLEQMVSKLKADFFKAISGAAVSEAEVTRLSKFLPSMTDQEQVFDSKLNTLIQETKRAKKNFEDRLGAAAPVTAESPVVGDSGINNDPLGLF